MSKNIICGEINSDDEWIGAPIDLFKKAVLLSKMDTFCIKTNNPQLVEAIEVLCGKNNINFYIYIDGKYYKQDRVESIYDYLGDVYGILNSLRLELEFEEDITDEVILKEIAEYELKHQFIDEETHSIDEEKFKPYVEILREPERIEAYQIDEPVVYENRYHHKRIAQSGDWIIKYSDGEITHRSNLGQYKEVEND